MHLNQDRQPEALGHLEQIGHVLIAQDRRNQQGRIGPGRPRLIELIGRQDEVLAQQRQVHDLTHLHQHLKAPLEERLVGQHRQAAGTPSGIPLGNRLRIEVLADHPLARAGLLDLSNHRRLAAGRFQRGQEVAGGGQGRHLTLELIQGHPIAGRRHFAVLLPDDLLEDVAGLALLMGTGVLQVSHLHLRVGGPAADLHGSLLRRRPPWRLACTPLRPPRSRWGGCAPHWPVASRSGGGPRRWRSPGSGQRHGVHRCGHRGLHRWPC